MYRKPSGKLAFSFNRMITAAVPNFANSTDDVELSPKEQDDLFKHQLSQPKPTALSELSFYVVGVVDSISQSAKVLESLKRASILSSHPDDPTVYTSRITKHFPNQMSSISIHKQRKLVAMLFFWEEELMRWKLLEDDEKGIRIALDGIREGDDTGHGEDLRIALSRILMKRNTAPSLRGSDGVDNREHILPQYEQGDGSVPVLREGAVVHGSDGST